MINKRGDTELLQIRATKTEIRKFKNHSDGWVICLFDHRKRRRWNLIHHRGTKDIVFFGDEYLNGFEYQCFDTLKHLGLLLHERVDCLPKFGAIHFIPHFLR